MPPKDSLEAVGPMLLYLGALKCADAGELALFLQAALLSQGHFSPQLPKHAEICAMVRAAEKHLRPKKMKLRQTFRELSSNWLLCLHLMPKALEKVISTLGQEHLALALKDLSRKEECGHSPGIWLGIFKGFQFCYFFPLHIQYSWLLSGRKCGEVGEVWRTEGNWQRES